jgi:hypothetical protein
MSAHPPLHPSLRGRWAVNGISGVYASPAVTFWALLSAG